MKKAASAVVNFYQMALPVVKVIPVRHTKAVDENFFVAFRINKRNVLQFVSSQIDILREFFCGILADIMCIDAVIQKMVDTL